MEGSSGLDLLPTEKVLTLAINVHSNGPRLIWPWQTKLTIITRQLFLLGKPSAHFNDSDRSIVQI